MYLWSLYTFLINRYLRQSFFITNKTQPMIQLIDLNSLYSNVIYVYTLIYLYT
jgi:hypothetical protein